MAEIIDYSKFNSDVRRFSRESLNKLQRNLWTLGIDANGYLEMSVKSSVAMQFGIASKVGYKFLEHGVFVEKGVGRGYPIESVKSNSAIINKASGRKPKPWYNPVLDEEVVRLADILQENLFDIAIKNIRIQ